MSSKILEGSSNPSPFLSTIYVPGLTALCLTLSLLLTHQPPPVLAVSQLDHGDGYAPLPLRSDEANAAAYMHKYRHYGRRAMLPKSPFADYGLDTRSEDNAAPSPHSIDIHLVAHTHDDVGWLSTPFAYVSALEL
jgi:hypothetical protein